MRPQIVNVRTYKGPYIYVARAMPGRHGHPLGNPFRLGGTAPLNERLECIGKYKEWLDKQPERDQLIRDLRQQIIDTCLPIACWCHPKPCHLDYVADLIERIPDE